MSNVIDDHRGWGYALDRMSIVNLRCLGEGRGGTSMKAKGPKSSERP